jgi:hypothetical protein
MWNVWVGGELPPFEPHPSFFFANRQFLLQIVWMDLLHSGRPLNRMGLAEFISPSQVMGEWVVL